MLEILHDQELAPVTINSTTNSINIRSVIDSVIIADTGNIAIIFTRHGKIIILNANGGPINVESNTMTINDASGSQLWSRSARIEIGAHPDSAQLRGATSASSSASTVSITASNGVINSQLGNAGCISIVRGIYCD